MPVLVDGNNLLHAAQESEALSLLPGRSMLCDMLGAWAERRREKVHVVFDGPEPSAALASQIAHPSIQVTYSGRGITADAVLNTLIEDDSAARRLLVVSSDREVAAAARRRGAKPVRSDVFMSSMKRDLARPAPPAVSEEREVGLSADAVEAWLREFGFAPPDRPRPNDEQRRRP